MIGSLQTALKKHEKVIGSLASILGTVMFFCF
ncbi:MAG: hypothetical protein BWY24_00768 [Microgenomates group bacterium ADurb.Bin219]|nr:MAG: hypothetical protein BWY24_00768 [Microgenomates group bacterium ADurb.Bin219]